MEIDMFQARKAELVMCSCGVTAHIQFTNGTKSQQVACRQLVTEKIIPESRRGGLMRGAELSDLIDQIHEKLPGYIKPDGVQHLLGRIIANHGDSPQSSICADCVESAVVVESAQ
jgi:hypothetical protein